MPYKETEQEFKARLAKMRESKSKQESKTNREDRKKNSIQSGSESSTAKSSKCNTSIANSLTASKKSSKESGSCRSSRKNARPPELEGYRENFKKTLRIFKTMETQKKNSKQHDGLLERTNISTVGNLRNDGKNCPENDVSETATSDRTNVDTDAVHVDGEEQEKVIENTTPVGTECLKDNEEPLESSLLESNDLDSSLPLNNPEIATRIEKCLCEAVTENKQLFKITIPSRQNNPDSKCCMIPAYKMKFIPNQKLIDNLDKVEKSKPSTRQTPDDGKQFNRVLFRNQHGNNSSSGNDRKFEKSSKTTENSLNTILITRLDKKPTKFIIKNEEPTPVCVQHFEGSEIKRQPSDNSNCLLISTRDIRPSSRGGYISPNQSPRTGISRTGISNTRQFQTTDASLLKSDNELDFIKNARSSPRSLTVVGSLEAKANQLERQTDFGNGPNAHSPAMTTSSKNSSDIEDTFFTTVTVRQPQNNFAPKTDFFPFPHTSDSGSRPSYSPTITPRLTTQQLPSTSTFTPSPSISKPNTPTVETNLTPSLTSRTTKSLHNCRTIYGEPTNDTSEQRNKGYKTEKQSSSTRWNSSRVTRGRNSMISQTESDAGHPLMSTGFNSNQPVAVRRYNKSAPGLASRNPENELIYLLSAPKVTRSSMSGIPKRHQVRKNDYRGRQQIEHHPTCDKQNILDKPDNLEYSSSSSSYSSELNLIQGSDESSDENPHHRIGWLIKPPMMRPKDGGGSDHKCDSVDLVAPIREKGHINVVMRPKDGSGSDHKCDSVDLVAPIREKGHINVDFSSRDPAGQCLDEMDDTDVDSEAYYNGDTAPAKEDMDAQKESGTDVDEDYLDTFDSLDMPLPPNQLVAKDEEVVHPPECNPTKCHENVRQTSVWTKKTCSVNPARKPQTDLKQQKKQKTWKPPMYPPHKPWLKK